MKNILDPSLNYCMYLRKSRKDLTCYSIKEVLARHKEQLLSLANYYQIHIKEDEIYEEIVSGETIEDRPVIRQLLKEVEKGKWAGVFVMEVERLARGDTIDQGMVARAFRYSNTKIITMLKVYDPMDEYDEEYFEFGLFMSRREYKTINRRLQFGRRKSAEEGKWVNSTPPYGWQRKKLPREKGYELIPQLEEAKVVRLIYDLYLGSIDSMRSYGISAIAAYLNRLGIRPRNKKEWSKSSIRGILTNPVHYGMIVWGRRPLVKQFESGKMKKTHRIAEHFLLTEGKHQKDAIITKEEFNRVQDKMKKHAPKIKKMSELQNPLAGLIYCSKCESKLVRKKADGKKRKEDTLFCPKKGCDNKGSSLSLIETRLLQALDQALKGYQKLAIPLKTKTKSMDYYLNQEIEKKQHQLEKICQYLEDGTYSKETFQKRKLAIEEQLARLQQEKIQLTQEKNKQQTYQEAIPRLDHLLTFYQENLSIDQKNILLHSLIDKVIYQKDQGGKGQKDNFHLTIYLLI